LEHNINNHDIKFNELIIHQVALIWFNGCMPGGATRQAACGTNRTRWKDGSEWGLWTPTSRVYCVVATWL